MSDRYAYARSGPGKATGAAAEPGAATPGKATLTQRLVLRGLSRDEVVAMIDAATRGGTPAPRAVAARSTYGDALRLHQGQAAAALTEAAGDPVVVVDDHVVVGPAIDPASPAGTAAVAQAISGTAGGDVTATTDAGSKPPPWPNGPTTKYKERSYPLADVLGWIREAEAIYGPGAPAVQPLRRMYYSAGTGSAGPLFDKFLATEDTTMPTAPPLAQTTLDRLYETGKITTPRGDAVDLSHVFVMFDLMIGGTSLAGSAANLVTPLAGLFTWTGDLASWFVAWLDGSGEGDVERGGEGGGEGGTTGRIGDVLTSPRDGESLTDQLARLEATKTRCDKDDLLGNMDAHALGNEVPAVAAGARSLADMLEGYYGAGATTGADRRFHRFVSSAVPAIPFVLVNASPMTVQLAPTAQQAIYDVLYNAVRSLRKMPVRPLVGHSEMLVEIAQRFTKFLQTGLATGDAPW